MILVDKEIIELVKEKEIITNFKEEQLGAISYDVTLDKFIINKEEIDKNEDLLPASKFIYIKTNEGLNMPNHLTSKVIEKNSLMRMGLKVDGPLYQPGHKTNIFLRIQNINEEDILLKKDMKIAQLIFLKLNQIPDNTYDKRTSA